MCVLSAGVLYIQVWLYGWRSEVCTCGSVCVSGSLHTHSCLNECSFFLSVTVAFKKKKKKKGGKSKHKCWREREREKKKGSNKHSQWKGGAGPFYSELCSLWIPLHLFLNKGSWKNGVEWEREEGGAIGLSCPIQHQGLLLITGGWWNVDCACLVRTALLAKGEMVVFWFILFVSLPKTWTSLCEYHCRFPLSSVTPNSAILHLRFKTKQLVSLPVGCQEEHLIVVTLCKAVLRVTKLIRNPRLFVPQKSRNPSQPIEQP